jgi:catechol 2,3-dioxygenase-like lactoylglutathione lyase family enzyme
MSTSISIKSIDHVVLTVQSVEKTVEFYTNILGMKHEAFRSPRNPDIERQVPIILNHWSFYGLLEEFQAIHD